jgi:hypothetical protein
LESIKRKTIEREECIKEFGIQLIRYTNTDVIKHINTFLEDILSHAATPSPPSQGGDTGEVSSLNNTPLFPGHEARAKEHL